MKKSKKIRKILKKPYARVLLPEKDGGYSALILEFPGCYACGDKVKKVLKDLEEAAVCWIEAGLDQKQKIPKPFTNKGKSLHKFIDERLLL